MEGTAKGGAILLEVVRSCSVRFYLETPTQFLLGSILKSLIRKQVVSKKDYIGASR